MDEVVKVINSKFEDKLKEMNMQSEQESRFNQQNVKHQMVMLSNRMNDVYNALQTGKTKHERATTNENEESLNNISHNM